MKLTTSFFMFMGIAVAGSIMANTGNAQTWITINTADSLRKAISPLIYGLNPYHYDNTLTGMALHDSGLNLKALRFGGDAVSTYNWELNSNTSFEGVCGSEYFTNSNNKFLAYASGQGAGSFDYTAGAALKTVTDANTLGAYPLIQISAMQYAAADHSGCISAAQCGNAGSSGRFRQIEIEKGAALSTTPSLTDEYVYADEEVYFLINQAGNSGSPNGIKGYCLENEPGIWSHTHQCAHTQRSTCAEVLSKNMALAKRIKQLDPGAETFGPGAYGYAEYMQLNSEGSYGSPGYYPSDWGSYNMSDVVGYNAADYQYMTWIAAYLRHAKMASDSFGARLLDVLDLHFYNEGSNYAQDSRSFWDSSYVESSWITSAVLGGNPYNAGNTFRKLIDDFYPGTKLAITEWGNFGNTNNPDYGIYTADMLGAMGRMGVYLATYFGRLKGFTAGAYKIFTNYDGANAAYGNTSVYTSSSNNGAISAYSSIQGLDAAQLHIVLLNRLATEQAGNITISAHQNYTRAQVYALKGTGGGSIAAMPEIDDIADNTFSINLLPKSTYHLVLSRSTTGIVPHKIWQGLKVFPNPTDDEVVVELDQATNLRPHFSMTDKLGRPVLPLRCKEITPGKSFSISLPKLAPDWYFLQLRIGNELRTEKISIR